MAPVPLTPESAAVMPAAMGAAREGAGTSQKVAPSSPRSARRCLRGSGSGRRAGPSSSRFPRSTEGRRAASDVEGAASSWALGPGEAKRFRGLAGLLSACVAVRCCWWRSESPDPGAPATARGAGGSPPRLWGRLASSRGRSRTLSGAATGGALGGGGWWTRAGDPHGAAPRLSRGDRARLAGASC